MSFETLKVSELKKIAEEFAVDVKNLKNKTDIIASLAEEGVTFSVYEKTLEKIQDEIIPDTEEVVSKFDLKEGLSKDAVLVKMERANFRYDILGYTFTKEHPFITMSEKDAQKIFDVEEGFRLATPREAQEFYS
jgi:hypothetical protein